MMKNITEAVIGQFDLAEAEGRLLRQKAMQVMGISMVLALAVLFGMAASGFFLVALYYTLIPLLQPYWVFCILGLLCLSIAGVLLWIIFRMSRKQ